MILFLLKNFQLFYNIELNPTIINEGKVIINSENFYLFNSIFNSFSSISSGSVLYLSINTDINLLIELCSFSNCYSNSKGGAICFDCFFGSFILYKVCGYNCDIGSSSWTTGGIFSYSLTSNSKIHQCLLTTISKCSNFSNTIGQVSISLVNGIQKIDNTNSTSNIAYVLSSITIITPFSSITSFCTIFNNKDNLYNCFAFMHGNGYKLLENSNIINNSSPSTYFPIIYSEYSDGFVNKCICYNNQIILFRHGNGASLTVSNCFILHDLNNLINVNNMIFTNNFYNFSSSYQINHLNCQNQIHFNSYIKYIFFSKFYIYFSFILI